MATSIISEAVWNYKKYVWTTDRQTDGQNNYRINAHIWEKCALHRKNRSLSQLGVEKITFTTKPDGHTDGLKLL